MNRARTLLLATILAILCTGVVDLTASPALAAPARPTADNTGVPAGSRLTSQTGDLTITRDGTVITGRDIQGCVLIRADDVQIRNSRIRCNGSSSGTVVQVARGYYGTLIADTEVDGQGRAQLGVGFGNFRLARVEVRNSADGVRAGSNSTVESSWIHWMVRTSGIHSDAIQSTGGSNIVIKYNSLDPRSSSGDPQNSAIMLGSEVTPTLSNVTVLGNWIDGGNFSVNVRGDTNASNVALRDNRFSATSRYGQVQAPASVAVDSSNVMTPGGARITVNRI